VCVCMCSTVHGLGGRPRLSKINLKPTKINEYFSHSTYILTGTTLFRWGWPQSNYLKATH